MQNTWEMRKDSAKCGRVSRYDVVQFSPVTQWFSHRGIKGFFIKDGMPVCGTGVFHKRLVYYSFKVM